jgi:hypothetical protein
MTSLAVENIREILGQQKTMPRPSSSICAVIAGLKDLCDIGPPQVEWRRPQASPSTGSRTFRNQHTAAPTHITPTQSFTRNSSSFSLGSGAESPAASTASPVAKKGGSPRYQSQFKNSSQPVEDKILNNIILSKLNKFCLGTYEEIREFLYQILGSGEADVSDMIRQFMLLVFKKAASEELYCSLYAKLLCEISQRYTVILDEMNILQDNYLAIFDEVEEKEHDEKYNTFIEKNIEKRYRQGYSQFIAELSTLEIIKLSQLEETFKRIFDSIRKNGVQPEKRTLIEEYIDCLLRMSRVFKKKRTQFIIAAKHSLMTLSKPFLDDILGNKDAYQSVSSKARFNLMDVKDNLSDS